MKTLSDLIQGFAEFRAEFKAAFTDAVAITKRANDAEAAKTKAEGERDAAMTAGRTAGEGLIAEQTAHTATKEKLTAAEAKITQLEADLKDPKGAAAKALVAAAAAAAIEVNKLPAGGEAEKVSGKTDEQVRAEFAAMPAGTARSEFFKKHKAQLI